MTFTQADANELLAQVFAPWIQSLDLHCDGVFEQGAELRMPQSEQLCREGGTVCGQALMALADTAAVLAVSAACGGYRPMTTVSQSIDLMRPLSKEDAIARATVSRLGRSMAFIRVDTRAANTSKPVATAQLCYALIS